MKTRATLILAAALMMTVAQRAHAQQKDSSAPATVDSARIRLSREAARQIAKSRVPNGSIESESSRAERGMLIYYFAIKGSDGAVQEIEVNAMSGEITKGRRP